MEALLEEIAFLELQRARLGATANKAILQDLLLERGSVMKQRSLLCGDGFAIRLSQVSGSGFSNTVLSLSALAQVDHQPAVVCVVTPRGLRFRLMNSTFLRKVSHSSLALREDNVRGSFNGSDIAAEYAGMQNEPANFRNLFALHAGMTWEENLARLVEATNGIVGRSERFLPSRDQSALILDAGDRAARAIADGTIRTLALELDRRISDNRHAILDAAAIGNVNIRGNAIERLVTGESNDHALGDLLMHAGGWSVAVDVKTKLAGLSSAPKAYNVDKALRFLADENTVLAFLLVEMDVLQHAVHSTLVPALDSRILASTVVQHHWAGRGSRGVTQLSPGYERVLGVGYEPNIDEVRAQAFLADLLEL